MSDKSSQVAQLRLVVEVDDFDAAVRFYRDVLGLVVDEAFEGEGDARIALLQAGRATLEIINSAQKAMIDDVEAGGSPSPRIRVAFEVDDTESVTKTLTEAGAELVAEPTLTPWQSLNSRLDAPGGIQLTIFQELDRRDPRD
jgi:catechol 2,3-dioxygenase-like lactoylglutathione lyase family enzyme